MKRRITGRVLLGLTGAWLLYLLVYVIIAAELYGSLNWGRIACFGIPAIVLVYLSWKLSFLKKGTD